MSAPDEWSEGVCVGNPRSASRALHRSPVVLVGAGMWMLSHTIVHLLGASAQTEGVMGPLVAGPSVMAAGIMVVALVWHSPIRPAMHRPRRWGLSPAAATMGVVGPGIFLVAEVLAHSPSSQDYPSMALLVIGCLVYALVGASTPPTLRRAVLAALQCLPTRDPRPAARVVDAISRSWAENQGRNGSFGRGPPFGSAARRRAVC